MKFDVEFREIVALLVAVVPHSNFVAPQWIVLQAKLGELITGK
jgi:hypothetical protein